MKRECSGNRLKIFFHKVVPAIMLVWKFLKVVTSVLLLGGDVMPQTFLPAACFGEKMKYLILGSSSDSAACICLPWPTVRSCEQRAASHGYLLNINLLTNLLANTWSKPEGKKMRQRGDKKPGTDKAQDTFNRTLESKFSTKLKFSLKS